MNWPFVVIDAVQLGLLIVIALYLRMLTGMKDVGHDHE